MSVKKKWTKGVIGASVFFLVAGCSLLPKEEQDLAPPLIEPSQTSVELFEVAKGSIVTKITGTAVFESRNPEYYRFETEGEIETIHVSAGDIVNAGDVLIEKVQPDLELDILRAELSVENKTEAFENAVKNGASERSIRIAQIELEIEQTKLESLRKQQADAKLVAASSGVVTYVAAMRPGNRFSDNDILVIISKPDDMRLSYQIRSSDRIEDVKLGMEVTIQFGNKQYTGKVTQTPLTAPDVASEQIAKEYANRIYIEMDEYPEDAEFGKLAQVELILDKREDTLVIPARGLRTYMNRPYVIILEGESRREVDVQVGLETMTAVEIVAGLEEGQQIILR